MQTYEVMRCACAMALQKQQKRLNHKCVRRIYATYEVMRCACAMALQKQQKRLNHKCIRRIYANI